jgi:hypothetical protein
MATLATETHSCPLLSLTAKSPNYMPTIVDTGRINESASPAIYGMFTLAHCNIMPNIAIWEIILHKVLTKSCAQLKTMQLLYNSISIPQEAHEPPVRPHHEESEVTVCEKAKLPEVIGKIADHLAMVSAFSVLSAKQFEIKLASALYASEKGQCSKCEKFYEAAVSVINSKYIMLSDSMNHMETICDLIKEAGRTGIFVWQVDKRFSTEEEITNHICTHFFTIPEEGLPVSATGLFMKPEGENLKLITKNGKGIYAYKMLTTPLGIPIKRYEATQSPIMVLPVELVTGIPIEFS